MEKKIYNLLENHHLSIFMVEEPPVLLVTSGHTLEMNVHWPIWYNASEDTTRSGLKCVFGECLSPCREQRLLGVDIKYQTVRTVQIPYDKIVETETKAITLVTN